MVIQVWYICDRHEKEINTAYTEKKYNNCNNISIKSRRIGSS